MRFLRKALLLRFGARLGLRSGLGHGLPPASPAAKVRSGSRPCHTASVEKRRQRAAMKNY